MPTFFQDEINFDIVQHTPRIAPVLGRANSPTNGAIWYDSASNAFQGVVNGVVAAIGGAGAPVFSAITPGTNTGALVIGTGGSLTPSGTGTITPSFPILAPNGTVSAPSFSFSSFPNYGMYAPGGNLAIAVAGAQAILISGGGIVTDRTFSAPLYGTTSNCSSSASPAVCGSATAGSFVLPAAATTVTVNTTAVTANSQIFVIEDDSLGTKLSVTCNTATAVPEPNITTRVASTSFSIAVTVAPATNPKCYSYFIVN